jgi:hypothetical protein
MVRKKRIIEIFERDLNFYACVSQLVKNMVKT